MGLFKLTKQDKDYQALQDMLSPKEDQGEETTTTGILSKPDTKKEEDEESTFLSFFGNVFDRSKSQAEEISRMMQEEAERSALEVRLSRQTAGITRSLPTEIANKRYNESALSGPMKLAPRALEEPVPVDVEELETPKESMDNERQSAINRMLDSIFTSDSDTTVVTDDADGGAAPSGKGLMAKPYDADRMIAVNEPLDSPSIVSAVRKADVTTDGVVDMAKVQDTIINSVGNNIYSAALLGAIKTEIGDGVKDEDPWYSVAGAKDVWLDTDVTKALNTLPAEQKARLLADEKSGKRTGGQASSADRKALGEAMWDIKYEGGKKYKGRGLIQITHKSNYEEVGKRLGLDLVKNPELVNDPKYAVPAAIAYMDYRGFFDLKPSDITKNKLQKLVNPNAPTEVKNERWKYATEYLKQIKDSGGSIDTSPRPRLRPEEIYMASN